MYAFQIIRNKETTEHICLICSVSVCRKTSIVIPKWGLGRSPKAGRRDARVDYNIKCNTKKYGHHTHFRVKCNYHKTKDTEVEYEVLYTFYTI
jgi:hypothetical protein